MNLIERTEAIRAAIYVIGIDPGTSTGLAIYDRKGRRFAKVATTTIIGAMREILAFHKVTPGSVFLRVEDARLRTWFGNTGKEKWQGVGSIKRDCNIWEEFLSEYQIPHEFIKPSAGMTKLDDTRFKALTGWKGRTSNHSRDAAMLALT